jgi:hypothetical protein
VNELAAKGVNISIRDHLKAQGLNFKDCNAARELTDDDGEGLEFVMVDKAPKVDHQEDEKPKMLQIAGQFVQ